MEPVYQNPSDIDLNIPFHPYQRAIRDMIIRNPYMGLFLACGLGKTSITLAAMYDINPQGHVLIIAPKNIARSTWQDEIEKWGFPFRTQSLVATKTGGKLLRAKRLDIYASLPDMPPTVFFINRELTADLVETLPKILHNKIWPFPMVVLDESQSFKSHSSNRFKALKTVRPQISRLVELTGTPTPKGLMDLWAQVYLLDMGARLGPNITAYRNAFFYESKYANGFPVEWSPRQGMEQEIYRRISDITVSVKNPGLKLPAVTFDDIKVHMEPAEVKRYRRFAKEQVLALMDGNTVTAANAAVLQAKLSQMASGTIYTDEEHHIEEIHDKKLEMLEYIVQNAGSPVMVAYWFNCDKDRILARIPDSVWFDGSPDMLHTWNAGGYPVMLIHPASSGFGLNFQDGGHTLVWYTLPWSLEAYIQTNARIHRQGQKNPVVIHRLLTSGTVDLKIAAALERKDLTEKALIEAVERAIDDL